MRQQLNSDNKRLFRFLVLGKASPLGACLSALRDRRVLLVALALGASVAGALVSRGTAHAVVDIDSPNSGGSSMVSQMTLDDQVRSYVYLNAIRKCVNQSGTGHWNDNNGWDGKTLVSEGDIKSGKWFTDGDGNHGSWVSGSYFIKKTADDGRSHCNDSIRSATKLWGFSDSLALACSYVKSRTVGGSSCATGAGDFGTDRADGKKELGDAKSFYDAIKDRVYGGATPTLQVGDSFPGRYLLYKLAFERGCSPKASTVAEKDFKYTVTVVLEGGTTKEVTYEGVKRDTSRFVYTDRDNLNELSRTCAQIAEGMNENATAYAKYLKLNPEEKPPTVEGINNSDVSGDEAVPSACNIDGVGWILCPVLTAGANLADSAYGFLADAFLRINTALLATDPSTTFTDEDGKDVTVGNGTYLAWGIMRNLANVAFVIVFLIIIFSQLTSVGVSNYGVKKMMPRLVVSAVLVNISFFVCQIAVDLSNIAGYGLKAMLDGVSEQIAFAGGAGGVNAGDESGHLGGILTLVIAGGALIWMSLGAVGLAIVSGVIVLLTVFVLLTIRQALVVLLIVLAPLAFVAYLLPNTEGLFKRWRKLLTAMLLLFPIIGLLFGAGKLASTVLLQVAGDQIALQVAAYMALIVPLIAAIPMLKGSLDAIPVLGKAIQNAGRRGDAMAQGGAKRAANAYKGSDWNKFRSGIKAERAARIRAGEYRGRGGKLNPRNWVSSANRAINDNAAFDTVTGGFGSRRGKSAAKWEGKEISEKAETLAGYLDANGLPIDPQAHFDKMLAKQQATYADPSSSEKVKRDARIDLAAAQAHLIRSNGQAGSEYARGQIANARSSGTGAPAAPPSPVSSRLQEAGQQIRLDNGEMDALGEQQLSRRQIENMDGGNIQAFADARSEQGIDALSSGNLLRIANAKRGTPAGDQARERLIARGVIKEAPKRDERTMPKK